MLLRISILLLLSGIVISQRYQEHGQHPKRRSVEQCGSSVCEDIAYAFLNSMDQRKKPCESFYDYACGAFLKDFQESDGTNHYSAKEQVENQIFRMLDRLFQKIAGNNKNYPRIARYVSNIYRQCLAAADYNQQKQWDEIEAAYHHIFYNARNYTDWVNMWLNTWEQIDNKAFFDVQLGPSDNPTQNAVHIFPARLNIDPADIKYPGSNLQYAFKLDEFLRTIAEIICKKQLPAERCGHTDINREILLLLSLEVDLGSARTSVIGTGNVTKMTLNEFSQESSIDWILIVKTIFEKSDSPTKIDGEFEVYVTDKEYFKNILPIFTKFNKYTIIFYFGLQAIVGKSGGESYAQYLSEQYRLSEYDIFKPFNGPKRQSSRKKVCLDLIRRHFTEVFEFAFVKHQTVPGQKGTVRAIFYEVKKGFTGILMQQWMDSETRRKAITKIDRMSVNIESPEWMASPEELDKRYLMTDQNLQALLNVQNFVISITMYRNLKARKEFHTYELPLAPSSNWTGSLLIPKIIYEPKSNTLTVPIAAVRAPLFNYDSISANYFGTIGISMMREMAYVVDPTKPQYDFENNVYDYMSESVREKFQAHADCLEKQYSGIYEAQAGRNIDGKLSLPGNLADMHGIEIAYKTFMDYRETLNVEYIFKEAPQFSVEKIFFLSYAQSLCTYYNSNWLRYYVQVAEESPARHRVNVALMNFKGFRDTFGCTPKANTTMCTLW